MKNFCKKATFIIFPQALSKIFNFEKSQIQFRMAIPNSPPIYNQKHDYKAFKRSWEWSWMDKNLLCSPATKRYKKNPEKSWKLDVKKNDFPNRQDLIESLFFCSQKKIWALKNPKLFTGPQCSNFSENWAETVTFWKTGAGIVILHQYSPLFLTKSGNRP